MMQKKIDHLFNDVFKQQFLCDEKRLPVHTWNPQLNGIMDLRICRDGQWIHENEIIKRDTLIKLFSNILRKEGDHYFLVTPVEKWQIHVDDVPFFITAVQTLTRDNVQVLVFETSTGEKAIASESNPLRVAIDEVTGEPSPYILVRDGMEGLLNRNVFYQLAAVAELNTDMEKAVHGVYSLGHFFPLE